MKNIFFSIINTKIFIYLLLFLISNKIWSQGSYMHEAAEESDVNPIKGLFALAIILGIVYLISKFSENIKEAKEAVEEEKFNRRVATSVSESSLEQYADISIFQNNPSWQKGYINATYDIQNDKMRRLYNKTIDDLIGDYKVNIRINKFIEANKIMEEIGYFQHLEHNNKLLIKEGKKPFDFVVINISNDKKIYFLRSHSTEDEKNRRK